MTPTTPKPNVLPFNSKGFTWQTFEDFFCDFLAAGLTLTAPDGRKTRVLKARHYGRKGERQDGIDIIATMEGNQVWVFQCKHYIQTKWTPPKTKKAIDKCTYEADRKFLLISQGFSEECRQIIESEDGWEIWNDREITQNFIQGLPKDEAARLIYTHFGPGWPEQFLDTPGSSPLVGGEAFYAQLLRTGISFHHRSNMIGRKEWLKDLDAFAKSKKRACLIIGRGGIGKSRLLLEWCRNFNQRHPNSTLRFISLAQAQSAEYKKAIDLCQKPLLLVLDDAHRYDVRTSILPVLADRPDVKIVLALRPGPTEQVRAELLEAQLDNNEIVEPKEIEPPSKSDAMKLAEELVAEGLNQHFRHHLARLARECPLLAILAAELSRSGKLNHQDFEDTLEFKDRVLRLGFEKDVAKIKEKYGEWVVDDFVKLIALMAPVRLDREFLESVAKFIGEKTRPDQLSQIQSELFKYGLLQDTKDGSRIVPDLLSDYLAYNACYDDNGKDRGFAASVLNHFPQDYFPIILQHLADAEWRACRKSEEAEKVTEPLWEWFIERFKNSSFYKRRDQLSEWGNIAHLQPERTIKLAELVLDENTAPEGSKNEKLWFSKESTHSYVKGAIPGILKPVANTHPRFTQQCLNILWKLGLESTLIGIPGAEENHPISIIGRIAGYEVWKSLAISEMVMQWLEAKFSGSDSLPPDWTIPILLKPYFKTSMEEMWTSGRMVSWCNHPLNIPNTVQFRMRARGLCFKISEKKSRRHTLRVLDVLEKVTAPFRFMGKLKEEKRIIKLWDEERLEALKTLEEILNKTEDALIQYQAWKFLTNRINHLTNENLRAAQQAIIDQIPDTFELRVLRVTLGHSWTEYKRATKDEDKEEWNNAREASWKELLTYVGKEVKVKFGTPSKILDWMISMDEDLREYDYNPDLRKLVNGLANIDQELVLGMAEETIRREDKRLCKDLDYMIFEATSESPEKRIKLCQVAIQTGFDGNICGAIQCLEYSRRHSELSGEAWKILLGLINRGSLEVQEGLLDFVLHNLGKPVEKDFAIIEGLTLPPKESQVGNLLYHLSEWMKESDTLITKDLVSSILHKLVGVSTLNQSDSSHFLGEIAKKYPDEVFNLLGKRVEAEIENQSSYQAIPHFYPDITLPNLSSSKEAGKIIANLENHLIEGKDLSYSGTELLRIGWSNLDEIDLEDRLSNLIKKASTKEGILAIAGVAKGLALHHPVLAKELLNNASECGDETYSGVFHALSILPVSRSASSSVSDKGWKAILIKAEGLLHQYANDQDLRRLYKRIVESERQIMNDLISMDID